MSPDARPEVPNALLDAALAYAARGCPALPLEPQGKRPLGALVRHGVKDATTDEATLREWWACEPKANVGIATGAASGFDVLDIDGEEGAASLAALESEHGPLPASWEVLTGGGGRHVFFAHRKGLRNAVKFAPGLDVRTDGGYIVAPPSVHSSGRGYAWKSSHSPGDLPLAPWPSWLADLIAAGGAPARESGEIKRSDAIVEGERNATLTSLAGAMRRRGMTETAILAALREENERRCRPPLDSAEVERIAASIARCAPEVSVTEKLDAAGFADLKAPIPASRLDATLRALAALAKERDAIGRAVLREESIRRLSAAGVQSPAALVDVALGGGPRAHDEGQGKQGHALELAAPEPWPEPVDGGVLLDSLVTALLKYTVLCPHGPEAIALWILHTHTWKEGADFSPRLSITGPTMRCGKSRVLEVLHGLVNRPLSTESVTPAALFRAIERFDPTLLIDEGDALLGNAEELRGLLNAGQRRDGSVIRTVGDDFEPREFSVFGPVAIASIGDLPNTVKDRSIVIPMRRKTKAETVARMRFADFKEETLPLLRKAVRWARDHEVGLRAARPVFPHALDDRAADGWEPLFAIADAAGGAWPELARQAAVALSAGRSEADGSNGVLALRDIRDLFAARNADRLTSVEIASALSAMEERPWGAWGRMHRTIEARDIARLLKPFGISPGSVRLPDGRTPKGYHRRDFEDAWSRWLAEAGDSDRHTATAPEPAAPAGEAPSATVSPAAEPGRAPKTESDPACGGVADETGEHREGGSRIAGAAGTAPDCGVGGSASSPTVCLVCGSPEGWRTHDGVHRCRRCHPPGPGAEAA